MSRILTAAIGVLLSACICAHAETKPLGGEIKYEIVLPNGEWTQVGINPRPQGQGVTVSYSREVGTEVKTVEKSFGPAILDDLKKSWGSDTFDISRWSSDTSCDRFVKWKVQAAGIRRDICRQAQPIARLKGLHEVVLALFR